MYAGAKRVAFRGRVIIDLSSEQMANFAGNVLELQTDRLEPLVATPRRALTSPSLQQRATIEEHVGSIVSADISTIETLGGGSVRCVSAVVHLPAKASRR